MSSENPDRFDVAVVGGGIAGLLLARELAGQASVAVFRDPSLPRAASATSMGIAAAGGMDSPVALTHALGAEAAQELWAWSRASIDSLAETATQLGVPVKREGSFRVALDRLEREEWEASLPLLQSWGEGVSQNVLDGVELERLGCGIGLTGGLLVRDDVQVDLPRLLVRLEEQFLKAGGVFVEHSAALDRRTGDGVTLLAGTRRFEAELVVVAAGAGASRVHPWFLPMTVPVRLQGLATGKGELHATAAPVLARRRFEAWCRTEGGGLQFVGCRWAEQPEMEAGITDDTGTSDRVFSAQSEFVHRHVDPDLDIVGARRWSGIASYSCDGLPLVGALPGEPRVLAMTGWGGWGLSWVGAAAQELGRAVLGGSGPASPPLVQPRRMV